MGDISEQSLNITDITQQIIDYLLSTYVGHDVKIQEVFWGNPTFYKHQWEATLFDKDTAPETDDIACISSKV